jgi:hypothetical protein
METTVIGVRVEMESHLRFGTERMLKTNLLRNGVLSRSEQAKDNIHNLTTPDEKAF